MEQELRTEESVQMDEKKKRGFNLSSAQRARKRLARLISMHYKGEIEGQLFRNLVYGCGKLLEYFKYEDDLRIEQEIEAIKKHLGMTE